MRVPFVYHHLDLDQKILLFSHLRKIRCACMAGGAQTVFRVRIVL